MLINDNDDEEKSIYESIEELFKNEGIRFNFDLGPEQSDKEKK